MSSRNIIIKLRKTQHHLPPKLATAVEKQTVLWMITVFLNALFTKHLLLQLLIIIFMVLVKILSKNVTITTINVLLEIEKNTELSKYVWKLKKRVVNYLINWDIAMKSQNYVCGLRKCDFCTCVKLLIARADLNVFLNKPDDPVLKWRHRNNLLWIALKIDKIIYTIRCMKLYLFFFLSINIVENYLMTGDMKHSVMVICCCGLYSILGAVIARAGKRF